MQTCLLLPALLLPEGSEVCSFYTLSGSWKVAKIKKYKIILLRHKSNSRTTKSATQYFYGKNRQESCSYNTDITKNCIKTKNIIMFRLFALSAISEFFTFETTCITGNR
jgi:hypothetical protein